MTLNPVTLLLTICGPLTGRVPVLDSPCVVGVFHSHAVGLRGAPYQTHQPGHMARNHSPCTVLSAHTRQTTACSVSTRIAQRRVELAAARPLPSPESPAVHKDSLGATGAALSYRPQTIPTHKRPPVAQRWTAQVSPDLHTPHEPAYGRGHGPDTATVHSRLFPQEKREVFACEFRRPVAAPRAYTREKGATPRGLSETKRTKKYKRTPLTRTASHSPKRSARAPTTRPRKPGHTARTKTNRPSTQRTHTHPGGPTAPPSPTRHAYVWAKAPPDPRGGTRRVSHTRRRPPQTAHASLTGSSAPPVAAPVGPLGLSPKSVKLRK